MNRLTLRSNTANLDPTQLDPTELNLFVVTAHPDDEALVAGLISKNVEAKDENGLKKLTVAAITATMGEASTEYHLQDALPHNPHDRQEHIKNVRKDEFYRAFGSLGVRELFLFDYPDGELKDMVHKHNFSEDITQRAYGLTGFYNQRPWGFLTLGPQGFDGHEDHAAAHEATMDASEELLRRYGLYLPVFGLNAQGNGKYVVPLTDELKRKKQEALRQHQSQMPFTEDGELDPAFFEALNGHRAKYEETLQVRETYDLYPPRVPYLLE